MDNLALIIVPLLVGIMGDWKLVSQALPARAMDASPVLALSLAAKSTTAPIAVGITQNLGGNTALVVFAVAVTGILGGVAGPEFLKFIGVQDRVATGIGIGAAIALMGIATAIVAPWLLKWLI